MNGNDKKVEQLGMPFGTASGILKKSIMFSMMQLLELDMCFQCGMKIESVNDLSIEHKIPWLDSENPKELFFSLDNIAFSHLKCNVGAVRKEYLVKSGKLLSESNVVKCPEGMSHCSKCGQFKPTSFFDKNITKFTGLDAYCKECKKERRKKKNIPQ